MTDAPGLEPVFRDDDSAEFFDAAAAGKLVVKRCDHDHYVAPTNTYGMPTTRCPTCHSPNLSWSAVSGEGALVSWTVVHRRDGPTQIAAIVELLEGPWMTAKLDVASDDGLRVGQPLTVHFAQSEGGEVIPVFGPTERSSDPPEGGRDAHALDAAAGGGTDG
ncbi:MAG TPA: OB-fold domain-containing protein [Acidimicrobiales bacterium]|nr:OB-fold domain-containing protein [Acidimicrobiales bacterium]